MACRDGWWSVVVGAAAVTHCQELRCVSLDESLASPLVTRARIARLAGGYSALAQLSSGEVLCMWEGPCTVKGANSLSEFCLASIQV